MTTVPVVEGDQYDDLVRKYQQLKIHCLNELLRRFKLPEKSRRQIAEELMFEEGSCFDGGWIIHEGRKLFPTLCFVERPFDKEDGYGDMTKLYGPPNPSGIHEYAGASVESYFEECGESVKDIECGYD